MRRLFVLAPLLLLSPAAAFMAPLAARRRTSLRAVTEPTDAYARSRRILGGVAVTDKGSAAGAAGSFEGLERLEGIWQQMKADVPAAAPPARPFVRDLMSSAIDAAAAIRAFSADEDGNLTPDYDVIICGGTLGIFLASALQRSGLKVAVIERGVIAGREQEWNISLDEVEELVAAGALDAEDVDGVLGKPAPKEVLRAEDGSALIAAAFGSVRAGFNAAQRPSGAEGLQEVWVPEVLNLGVRPKIAVERARRRFEDAGGVVFERTGVDGIDVLPSGAVVKTSGSDAGAVTGKLVVDAMGNASPIAREMRAGRKPFGVCAVVGSQASGFSRGNDFADLIFTNEDITVDASGGGAEGDVRRQYFWEAFPSGSGGADRTTYLFTYMDASEERGSLLDMMEDYWSMLPAYQAEHCDAFARGMDVEQAIAAGELRVNRVLYGCFPTYKDSPLAPPAARILAIGDASGIQSPLSFGGFGALTRHLLRLRTAIGEAIEADALSAKELRGINPYLPNLSATWMFQRSMMVPIGSGRSSDFVNRLLNTNFQIMEDLGREVLRPFNQDVVRPVGLLRVLSEAFLRDPLNIAPLVYHLGPLTLLDWLRHMLNMVAYYALYKGLAAPLRAYADGLWEQGDAKKKKTAFKIRRTVEAWEYGSGEDYSGF